MNSTTAPLPRYTELHKKVQSKLKHIEKHLTIIPSDKRISVFIRDNAIYMLLCLLERYVHVTIKAGQNT